MYLWNDSEVRQKIVKWLNQFLLYKIQSTPEIYIFLAFKAPTLGRDFVDIISELHF